jgi:hypothetical protein
MVLTQEADGVRLRNVPLDEPCRFYRVKWNTPNDVLPLAALELPDGEPEHEPRNAGL